MIKTRYFFPLARVRYAPVFVLGKPLCMLEFCQIKKENNSVEEVNLFARFPGKRSPYGAMERTIRSVRPLCIIIDLDLHRARGQPEKTNGRRQDHSVLGSAANKTKRIHLTPRARRRSLQTSRNANPPPKPMGQSSRCPP